MRPAGSAAADLLPARLAAREVVCKRGSGLRRRSGGLLREALDVEQILQLLRQATVQALGRQHARHGGDFREGLSAGEIVGPAADAGRRPAGLAEMPHGKVDDLTALEGEQGRDQRFALDFRDPEVSGRQERSCKHSYLPSVFWTCWPSRPSPPVCDPGGGTARPPWANWKKGAARIGKPFFPTRYASPTYCSPSRGLNLIGSRPSALARSAAASSCWPSVSSA